MKMEEKKESMGGKGKKAHAGMGKKEHGFGAKVGRHMGKSTKMEGPHK